MTTAFAASLIHGPVPYMGGKAAAYKVQMPNPTTSHGDTWDLSGEFDYVKGIAAQVSGAVTDHGYQLRLVGGTYSAAGYPAATVKIVAHKDTALGGAFTEASSANLSAINDLTVVVWGQ